jgi:hypothetical protein
VIFETRVVIGKERAGRSAAPEFSDEMEHMVVNPSWGVPRSIIVKEYLPLCSRIPMPSGICRSSTRGRVVIARVGQLCGLFNARTFPFGCVSRRRTGMRWGR